MAVLVLAVPGSKIVVKSLSVKRNAKNARELERNRAPPPTFPSSASLIVALPVLVRPHYILLYLRAWHRLVLVGRAK